ncbi:deleted in malignant brain tumors 1 protein-like [Lytechinus variegatus]|uniref:deleted in malignant brain tumors 1 protein-like n=1 Tax=Lytechinus variegatus TaxID=7654 RepID=UPI001BB223DB|nr:deleted in malignant brain tumors 1 protein-like [Lytechinus variegatus]
MDLAQSPASSAVWTVLAGRTTSFPVNIPILDKAAAVAGATQVFFVEENSHHALFLVVQVLTGMQCISVNIHTFKSTLMGNIFILKFPGELMPFLTAANTLDAIAAIWESSGLVEGMGDFCLLVAPRLTAAIGPDLFRGICDPVLAALESGTSFDGEQMCALIYSIISQEPFNPYPSTTETPPTTSTQSRSTPGYLPTGFPSFLEPITPFICVYPLPSFGPSYALLDGPPLGIEGLRNFDPVSILTQAVENVLDITTLDQDSVCSAVGRLTSEDIPPRDLATEFMVQILAGFIPIASEICDNWDDFVQTIRDDLVDTPGVDVEILTNVLPDLIALMVDFPNRESLCDYIQTISRDEAVIDGAGQLVASFLTVLTDNQKCIDVVQSTLGVVTGVVGGISMEEIENVYIPLYSGFRDVHDMCLYVATSFSQRSTPLPVRLVDGDTPNDGRVEVQYNGAWGTVCGNGFDGEDATVVCRQLGYRGESSVIPRGQNLGTGDILLSNVECMGVELSIVQCPHEGAPLNPVYDCNHNQDVSVSCSLEVVPPSIPPTIPPTPPTTESHFEMRLVGGNTENEGRLEVFYQGQWGTVCDDYWDSEATDVACRALGFQGGERYDCCAEYGRGNGPIILDDVQCSGTEDSILACDHNPLFEQNCGHSEDIGITCTPRCEGDLEFQTCGSSCPLICNDQEPQICPLICVQECQCPGGLFRVSEDDSRCVPQDECPLPVRLVGGGTSDEGRVEVLHDGEWGTICDDKWDIDDASVVCRMLGFPRAARAPIRAYFGQGTGPITLDNVDCSGRESSIFDCRNSGFGVHNCGHHEDASVICMRQAPLELRLAGGNGHSTGRVEIRYKGVWGTICDDLWDLNDAAVVCRMLGFPRALRAPGMAYFGEGTGQILLDNVNCAGDEESLAQCSHPGYSNHNCVHHEDAGVVCSP